ncbi:hypothetical protein RND71_003463 [Anisodus tanguticus]|uniref:Uncharacterized protein n=1 Tax=Anisodus tanguticus TaxID=243964 RepID=A0AAE1VQ03_9SOLA|nr:hypothetical protein RND71_003463 [Anisodus tanguticus]
MTVHEVIVRWKMVRSGVIVYMVVARWDMGSRGVMVLWSVGPVELIISITGSCSVLSIWTTLLYAMGHAPRHPHWSLDMSASRIHRDDYSPATWSFRIGLLRDLTLLFSVRVSFWLKLLSRLSIKCSILV